MLDSSWPHGLQHTRLPCPSPTSGACSNSCPSNWWCHRTISSSVVPLLLPSVCQHQGLFQWALRIRWPNYWSFSFHISPSNEYSGLISFRIDWFDLLAVHGILKSLLQHHSSKASILQRSAFFVVQLSHDYWKNHSFDCMDLCWQSNALLFNMLSRLVIAFLPRSKRLLISLLLSPFVVILEPMKIFVVWMLNF